MHGFGVILAGFPTFRAFVQAFGTESRKTCRKLGEMAVQRLGKSENLPPERRIAAQRLGKSENLPPERRIAAQRLGKSRNLPLWFRSDGRLRYRGPTVAACSGFAVGAPLRCAPTGFSLGRFGWSWRVFLFLGALYSDFAAYSCTFNAKASGTCLMRWTCASATARYVANPMAITSTMAAVGT